METLSLYPASADERDRWIVDRRPPRNTVDPSTPYAFLVEQECSPSGALVSVATIFLTNRECPWRCVMCDLWQNTLTEPVPAGAIPAQIRYALARMPEASHIKLYNSGSFFDSGAIAPDEYPDIADLVRCFERVIVESHPLLVGERTLRLRDLLHGQLEVALGLETIDPRAMERLNKRVTLAQFSRAAEKLQKAAIDLRVFILVQPPFTLPEESLLWAERSIDFAFDRGATLVALIATRPGNGATEHLQLLGEFQPPALAVIEAAFEYGLGLARGRVLVDLWDLRQTPSCGSCRTLRIERLRTMNLVQHVLPAIPCDVCGGRA